MYYIEKDNEIVLFDIDFKTLRDNVNEFYPQYIGLPIQETEENIIKYNNHYYLESDIQTELEKERRKNFNKEFFHTSLGYVRRTVTMADGSHNDFLTALLPSIAIAVNMGQTVNILTYDKPPFDSDVVDWQQYQHQQVVTPQFIQECFNQLNNDFLPQL